MLPKKIKTEIEIEAGHYPLKSAACIDALKIVQQHNRWVSDENIKEIASILDMSPAEVDSVATFYNRIYRKPVGEHVILLCDSISCWVMGYEDIYKYISVKLGVKLGETTTDGKFTLLPNCCLGNCDKSPCMIIDDKTYGNLTNEKIEKILSTFF
jgi:NADH-quinone oxidoreductase subunit E